MSLALREGTRMRMPMYAARSPENPRNQLTIGEDGLSERLELYMEALKEPVVLVGFVVSVFQQEGATAIGMVEHLQVGDEQLFLHRGPANATTYDTTDRHLIGLVAYPELAPGTQPCVTIQASGEPTDILSMACSMVVAVLNDDPLLTNPGLRQLLEATCG